MRLEFLYIIFLYIDGYILGFSKLMAEKVRYWVKIAMDLSKGMSMSINSPERLLQFMTAKLRS